MNFKTMHMLKDCLCLTIQWLLSKMVLGGGGNPIGAFSPPSFTIVVMKTSSTFANSLLE